MQFKFLLKSLLACGVAALLPLASFAQAPASDSTPVRIRGTIEKLDGKTLVVKTRDGGSATIALADNFAVSALAKKTVSDIKPNDYIASTGVKGTDGKLHCVELRIFPEAQRGTGEGQFAWDGAPNSTMTNATVTGVVQSGGAGSVKVVFKGTESEFAVDAECQVYAYVPGSPDLLKAGAAVFTVAQKKPDGSLTAARITAEKDGIKPPM